MVSLTTIEGENLAHDPINSHPESWYHIILVSILFFYDGGLLPGESCITHRGNNLPSTFTIWNICGGSVHGIREGPAGGGAESRGVSSGGGGAAQWAQLAGPAAGSGSRKGSAQPMDCKNVAKCVFSLHCVVS